MQITINPVSNAPKTFRRTLVSVALYPPMTELYDRQRYGNEAVDAVLLKYGQSETLTEFQSLLAMGYTRKACALIARVAEFIRPQVMREARRAAGSTANWRYVPARRALSTGCIGVCSVEPWIRAALDYYHADLHGYLDQDGDFLNALCRYYSRTPFAEHDIRVSGEKSAPASSCQPGTNSLFPGENVPG